MSTGPASQYANRRRPLAELLGIAPDALPGGGNFHPEEDVLLRLAEEAIAHRPSQAVALGAGLGAVVLALAVGGAGRTTIVEDDARRIALARAQLSRTGGAARFVEAGLEDYDGRNLWYPRQRTGLLPTEIDFLFIDGPGHYAGRTPRWPAGPELFPRLSARAIVLMDDGKRVKEKKTLRAWAEAFPDLQQIDTKTSGGAVLLRRR